LDFEAYLQGRLADIRGRGLYREMKTLTAPHRIRTVVDGAERIVFNSNDYLGLAGHPRLVRRAREALETWGFGSPASRLISGNTALHEALEEALARFKGEEAAILFPSGYMANLGVLTSLVEPGDRVLSDALNHASLVDACRLCRGDVEVYPHLDAGAVKEALARRPRGGKAYIVTDGVFSMDGDVAPMPALREAADREGAWIIADEAHATGVLGETGRGLAEHFGPGAGPDVCIGTLGKALGGQGGFVAGSRSLIELLRNRARTFLYTTAPMPALCGGVLEALALLEEEPERVTSLGEKAALFRRCLGEAGVPVPGDPTPIVPVITGEAERTMEAAEALFEAGYFVTGIRPPSVPRGSCRLRMTVMEPHTEAEIRGLAEAVGRIL